jgi:putative flippase GtrA
LEIAMSAALFSMMPNAIPAPVEAPSMLGQLAAFLAIGAAGAGAFVALSSTAGHITGNEGWTLNALCYAVLIGPVYLAHRRFSFQSDLPHSHALPRYIGVQVMALVLVAMFSWLVYRVFGMTSVGASSLVIVLTSGLNFMLLRGWAFAKSTPFGLARLVPAVPVTHE